MKFICFKNGKCKSYEISEAMEDNSEHDMISKYTGHIGEWNLVWVGIISLLQITFGLQTFAFPFQTVNKDFWCAGLPSTPFSSENSSLNSCVFEGDDPSLPPAKCSNFEFSHEYYGTTIIEDFNLVCDRKYLIASVETCGILGTVLASVISGWISDKYGRKPILMISLFLQVSLGTLLAFSNTLVMLMILRVLVGFATSSVFILNDVLVMELVSPKYRSAVGILNMMMICVGNVILAGAAYLERDWRNLQIMITAPWIILLLTWYCIPESPRWLLAMEKYDQLMDLLKRMSKVNHKTLPSDIREILEKSPKEVENNKELNLFKEVFSKPYFWKTVLLLLIYFTMGGIYVALSLHLVGLGGDIYLNVAVSSLVEMFVTTLTILFALKFEVGQLIMYCMLACGISLLSVNIVSESWNWGVIALAILARCLSGASNNVINSYAAKLFPTHIRNFAIGLGYFSLGVSGVVTPYIWLLEHVYELLPLTIMGIYGIAAVFLLCIIEKL
ncbi:hypothetical protein ACFFRR_000030 [Megaselia abdita]